jgi:ACS family hexuronate transporter-like MFS transporter
MQQQASKANPDQEKRGRYRWTVCGLIFFATTINYLDRAVISLLKPYLETEFSWSESDYANIVIAFQIAYAVGLFCAGRLIDRWGTKIGYAVALFTWSIAAIGHSLVRSTFGFIIARAALGVTEAGNFPSAIKATAEWFPKKERALATGIFNSGTNVGAILAPLSVPFIAESLGWRWAFLITGGIGFIWLFFWFVLYEVPQKQKRLGKVEFDFIHSDKEEFTEKENTTTAKNVSWLELFKLKQTWAFTLGKFLTDPIWWFYLFWLPAFLKAEYNVTGTAIAFPVALVYTMSSVGSIVGGWLPYYFINRGWPVFRARKTAMFIYACFVVPVIFAQWLGAMNMWLAVIIIGVATSAHQAWSANIFTTVSDMFPKQVVGSVTGIGGMAGAAGSVIVSALAGKLFDYYKGIESLETGYYIMFFICGGAYLIAWFVMHLLTPSTPTQKDEY